MSARERLLDAALDRFSAEGALAVSLDRVRQDAAVSTGALYHHFPDKRALATALYVDGLAGYQAEVLELLRAEHDARRGIEGVVRTHLRWSARNRALALFLLTQRGAVDETPVREASRPFLREVTGWYRGHAHYGAVRDLPFELVHALWLGPSQEYLRHRLPVAPTVPRPTVTELARAAWRALEETP